MIVIHIYSSIWIEIHEHAKQNSINYLSGPELGQVTKMICIIDLNGSENTPEQEAARTLQNSILQAWPEVKNDSAFRICILPNVKCYGQDVSDIDLLVMIECPTNLCFRPIGPVPNYAGDLMELEAVEIRSL